MRALASRHHRQLVAARRTQLDERAGEAARIRRRAHRGAELHEALVEVARCRARGERCHQLAGPRPQSALAGCGLHVLADRVHAREHACDVAVDERCTLAERDRRDRTCRVRPDAGHAAQLARARRQRAALLDDSARPRPQVARARVVAESGPRGEHVVQRCGCERAHRRKLRHPLLPVRDDGLHARLLQHDLADPDRVRVARRAPGQIPPSPREVRDDRRCDRALLPGSAHALNCTGGSSRSRSDRRPTRSRSSTSCPRSSDRSAWTSTCTRGSGSSRRTSAASGG